MKTLGIDLSADHTKTAVCVLHWTKSEFEVAGGQLFKGSATHPLEVSELVELIGSSDWTGIDCPFGWPAPFVEALKGWNKVDGDPFPEPRSLDYQRRVTDQQDELNGMVPLSVSSDRIGVTAMKCTQILHATRTLDRSGWQTGTRVVEVYPAGALNSWGLDPKGYKQSAGRIKRSKLLDELLRLLGDTARIEDKEMDLLRESDDCLDAFIASLVARTRSKGRTTRPGGADKTAASTEGWMHLPKRSAGFPECLF